jgi:hypothetical protein
MWGCPMSDAPDEVDKLADALLDDLKNALDEEWHADAKWDLRKLARDAAAVGARTALEDVRDELNGLMDSLDDSVIADETERLAVYEAILAVWKLTTDEETTT